MTADVDLDTLTRLAQAVLGTGHWEARPATDGDPADGPTMMRVESEHAGVIADFGYDSLEGPIADFIGETGPDVVLALVERVRAAEAAVERVRALGTGWRDADGETVDASGLTMLVAANNHGRMLLSALDGSRASTSARVDPESTDDPNGPQNAANEGDA